MADMTDVEQQRFHAVTRFEMIDHDNEGHIMVRISFYAHVGSHVVRLCAAVLVQQCL